MNPGYTMKLSSLNPKMTGGCDGTNEISFDCPVCGPPYRISIRARLNGDPAGGIWRWTRRGTDWDSITISPSISNSNHGKKKTCTCHITITNGKVQVA